MNFRSIINSLASNVAVEIRILIITSRYIIPVEGKSSDSECLICMKYMIIILIIIIISLGQIFYRILQTHHACTHARARTRAHTQPSPPSPPSPSVVISQAMCLTYSAMLKDRDYDVTAHIFLILSLKLTQNARGGRRRFARWI